MQTVSKRPGVQPVSCWNQRRLRIRGFSVALLAAMALLLSVAAPASAAAAPSGIIPDATLAKIKDPKVKLPLDMGQVRLNWFGSGYNMWHNLPGCCGYLHTFRLLGHLRPRCDQHKHD